MRQQVVPGPSPKPPSHCWVKGPEFPDWHPGCPHTLAFKGVARHHKAGELGEPQKAQLGLVQTRESPPRAHFLLFRFKDKISSDSGAGTGILSTACLSCASPVVPFTRLISSSQQSRERLRAILPKQAPVRSIKAQKGTQLVSLHCLKSDGFLVYENK